MVILFLFSAVNCIGTTKNLFLVTIWSWICHRLFLTGVRSPRSHGAPTGAAQAAHQDEGAPPSKDADGDFARAELATGSKGAGQATSESGHAPLVANPATATAAHSVANLHRQTSSPRLTDADMQRDARTFPAGGVLQRAAWLDYHRNTSVGV